MSAATTETARIEALEKEVEELRKTLRWPTPEDAFRAISRFSNGGSHEEKEEFARVFAKEHNTLQQAQVGLFLRCIYQLAEQADNGWIDLRNEASGKAAQKIRDLLGPHGYSFPLI